MNVAVVVGPFPSLSETFILRQITGLIDRGHHVDIYASRRGDDRDVHGAIDKYALLDRTRFAPPLPGSVVARAAGGVMQAIRTFPRAPGATLRSLNVPAYGRSALSLQLLYGLTPWLPRKRYDIVHAHFGPNALRAALLRDIGVVTGKLVTTFHGHDVNRYPMQHGSGVYRRLFATGDLFTANTRFTADKAVGLGCPVDRIAILPMGVDLTRYALLDRAVAPDRTVRILSVARLVEKKGLEYAIRAVAGVMRDRSNVEYDIVGDGELQDELASLIRDLNVAGRIRLLGAMPQERIIETYARSDVFLLPSVTAADGDQEGQGLVLQEAQATGLPVVTTRHNGIPDGVLDGRSGFLVPERDVDALADKLAVLIDHPDVRVKMGTAGRRFVEQHYDIEKLNDRLVELYRSLMI